MSKVSSSKERLENVSNFMTVVCIDGGVGYDLKVVVNKLISGDFDFDDAVVWWESQGYCFLTNVSISHPSYTTCRLLGKNLLKFIIASKKTNLEIYQDDLFPGKMFYLDCEYKLGFDGDWDRLPSYSDFSIFEIEEGTGRYISSDGCLEDLLDKNSLDGVLFDVKYFVDVTYKY